MTKRKNADGTKRRKGGHNKRVFTNTELEDIQSLYVDKSMSLRQIALKYNTTKQVIRNALVAMGMTIDIYKRFTGSKVEVLNPDINVTGLCYCGCGGIPGLRRKSYKKRGWMAGDRLMYVTGHGGAEAKLLPVRYKIDEETGCWVWQLQLVAGYGKVKKANKVNYAHVYHWTEVNGPVPTGKFLDHLCRNKACVNPDHLEPVTAAQNSQRGANAKLNWEKVREIRKAYADGSNSKALAPLYGVTAGHIMDVVNQVCWREDVITTVPNRPIEQELTEVQRGSEQAVTDSAHGYGENSLSSQPEFASWLHW